MRTATSPRDFSRLPMRSSTACVRQTGYCVLRNKSEFEFAAVLRQLAGPPEPWHFGRARLRRVQQRCAAASVATAAAHRSLPEAAAAVFLVEDVACRRDDVGYFRFAKNDACLGCAAQRLREIHSRQERMRFPTCERLSRQRRAPPHLRLWSDASASEACFPRNMSHPACARVQVHCKISGLACPPPPADLQDAAVPNVAAG